MRPSRGTLNSCDIRPSATLRWLQEPKWPLVTRLLGLGHDEELEGRQAPEDERDGAERGASREARVPDSES
jgi:hypothetical protein